MWIRIGLGRPKADLILRPQPVPACARTRRDSAMAWGWCALCRRWCGPPMATGSARAPRPRRPRAWQRVAARGCAWLRARRPPRPQQSPRLGAAQGAAPLSLAAGLGLRRGLVGGLPSLPPSPSPSLPRFVALPCARTRSAAMEDDDGATLARLNRGLHPQEARGGRQRQRRRQQQRDSVCLSRLPNERPRSPARLRTRSSPAAAHFSLALLLISAPPLPALPVRPDALAPAPASSRS